MAHASNYVPSPICDHPVPWVEFHHSVPSRVAEIAPVVDRLMSLIRTGRRADGSEVDIEIALGEALMNAVVHGNHEAPEKTVDVTCRCGADGAVDITIRDQGDGFDWQAVTDPTLPENIHRAHGRGIYLMRRLMDEVWFGRGGSVVCIRKKPNSRWA